MVCEADAQTRIRIFQHGADCRSLLRRDWQCILHHTRKVLCGFYCGLKSMERLKIFSNPPPPRARLSSGTPPGSIKGLVWVLVLHSLSSILLAVILIK